MHACMWLSINIRQVVFLHTYTDTGLFEGDHTVSVAQWTPFTGPGSEFEGTAHVDTAPMNDVQPSSTPGSQPFSTSQPSSIPASQPSSSDVSYHPTELKLCTDFIQSTCGCKKAKGKPCSSLFPLDHYIDLRAQSSLLTRDELDLTLLGCIMCTVITDEYIRNGRHKPTKRRRTSMSFIHHSHEVCKTTFCFLYGVGRKRIMALKDSYLANGLETRVHGNRKRLPHNQMTHRAITNVVKFLENYAEENAILLPGRIPSYKRDDIKLLPSSRSKKVICMSIHIKLCIIKNNQLLQTIYQST